MYLQKAGKGYFDHLLIFLWHYVQNEKKWVFLQSKLFYFSLVQNAQDDLISEECRQIIRACTVFLLCMDSPVDPSLHGISWFCVGCCLHLQIVPQNASVLSSLCTPAPICYLLVYNKPPQNLTAGGGMIPCFNSHCLFPSHPFRKGRRVSSYQNWHFFITYHDKRIFLNML